MIPSKEKLEEIIKELAKIMRIQDWDIDFRFVNRYEMQDETGSREDVADCYRNRKLKYARISLRLDSEQVDRDWYEIIVHEMYHIVTDDWHYHTNSLLDFIKDGVANETMSNIVNVYYERTIEALAKGFVNAYPVTNFIKEDVQNG